MERFRDNIYTLWEVDRCIEKVLEYCFPSVEERSTQDALFHCVADDITAPYNIPRKPTSIMDGFALRACTDTLEYDVVQEIHANKDHVGQIAEQKAVYITTGGIMPVGADAVVPVEDAVEVTQDRVVLPQCKSGQYIRQVGSDTKEGDVVLTKHSLLAAGDIGILAACGISRVPCFRRPKVAVISTGDELHDIASGDIGNGIFDANRPILTSLIREEHCEVVDFGIIEDDDNKLRDVILEAGDICDIVVLSGGVSRGNKDYVKPILEDIGVVHFGSMNMKPGKPTTFATLKASSSLVFGLPGNPASCFVTFKLLLVPALRKLRGKQLGLSFPKVRIRTLSPLQPDPTRPEYVRACAFYANSQFCAEPCGFQRSSRAQSCAQANCLLLVPPLSSPPDASSTGKCKCSMETSLGVGAIAAGSELDGYLFDELMPPTPSTSSTDRLLDTKSVHPAQAHVHEHAPRDAKSFSCGLLTVSDRAWKGVYEDKTGPASRKAIEEMGGRVIQQEIVPDNAKDIQRRVSAWAAEGVQVILTLGGTGFSPHDVTPEAISPLLTKHAPGLAFAIMQEGVKHTPFALLSRPVCGIILSSIVCTLPGSPKGAVEGIGALKQLLPHATHLISSPPSVPCEASVRITHAPIDTEKVCALVQRAECGAMVTFHGTTRNHFEGKVVVNLAYEAYEPMAVKVMEKIKHRAEHRFLDTYCAIVHRVGNVPVKEASLLIVVSSPHRAEAFDCSRYILEEVKALVPVWKKEEYSDGTATWKKNEEWSH